MTKNLAAEEGPNGIRVNAVCPGVTDAGLAVKLMKDSFKTSLDSARQATPLRRVGQGAEIAELVAFLASSKGAYITGQMIVADGGLTL
jgi:NAD(P)-dependent dehydrogenase (short-subunit alcohol dehydrogenase family)